MPDLLLPTLACAVALALVHLVTPRLTFVRAVPRSRWLSFAGGVAVAYVFMHVLPELAEHGRRLGEQQDAEIAIYALSLAGLATFYGLERTVRQARAFGRSAGAGRGRTFWLHVGSFTAYNLLIGYLLLHREDPGALSLALYFTAMALHFFTNDCTAPGSLDNGLHYAASLRLAAIHRSRAAAGLMRPFLSTSHSVL
jgi:zinc transporter ZupT